MRLLLISAAALLVAQAPASAQTAAKKRAREAVAIINTATPRLLKAYVDSAFGGRMRDTPPDAYVNIFLGLRERSGGLEWVSVQEESAYRAVVRMTRKLTGETNALEVSVEEASPHRVTTLDLRPVYHRKETRIRSHVLLCWLSLLLIRIAENATGETWRNLRTELDKLHLGRFSGSAGEVAPT